MNEAFRPDIGEKVESSRRLELSYDDQSHLCQQAIELSDQLDLIAQPQLVTERAEGIKLRPFEGLRGNDDTELSVGYGEIQGKAPSAHILFSDPNGMETRAYTLGQLNTWEEILTKGAKRGRLLTTTDLIIMLSRRLPEETLATFMDDPAVDGLELAKYLTHALQPKAKDYQKKRQYIAVETQAYEGYNNTITHTLLVKSSKREDEIHIATDADYDLGGESVNKQYHYTMKKEIYTPRKKQAFLPKNGGGVLTLRSVDGISKARLDALAAADADESYPADTLRHSLEEIIRQYDRLNRAA